MKLAELEEAGKLTAVITQNIDGLHQAAGSKNVLELHGSIHRNYCMKCHKFYDAAYVKNASGCLLYTSIISVQSAEDISACMQDAESR